MLKRVNMHLYAYKYMFTDTNDVLVRACVCVYVRVRVCGLRYVFKFLSILENYISIQTMTSICPSKVENRHLVY